MDILRQQVIIFSCFFILLVITGCSNSKLNMFTMPKAPTEGPPEYINGWKAGCETGMTAYSHGMLRTRYRTNVDGAMMRNKYYNKGWVSGNRYCNYYVSRYLTLGTFDDVHFTHNDLREGNTWFNADNNIGGGIFKLWQRPG